MWNDFFTGWKFDIRTSIATLIIIPAAAYILVIIRKFIISWAGYILEGGLYWFARFFKQSLAGTLTLRRYCKLKLGEDSKYLYVPSSQGVKLEIDKVFVTMTLDAAGGQSLSYSNLDILTAGSRLRVIGDPGSGKSSLIKRVYRDQCLLAYSKPSRAQLPILIELKSLSIPSKLVGEPLGEWFINHLKRKVAKSKVYKMEDCFTAYSEDNGLLVLLDGLDEVSTIEYPRTRSAIDALSQSLSQRSDKNVILVTMRTQFHEQIKDDFRDSFGQAFFVKAFSPSDIYQFLSQWPFRANEGGHIARIYKELTDRPTLREMCSNPLVLSMYVAEDQAAGHLSAPDSRTEFYRKVTEELLVKRRALQVGPQPAQTKLKEQREAILGAIAYHHLVNTIQSPNALDWDEALRIVKTLFKNSTEESESIFREMSKETGLFTEERSKQSFRFIHLTFCEYFAAYEAVNGRADGWDALLQRAMLLAVESTPQAKTRLSEVIPFAAGLLPRMRRNEAITQIARLGDRSLLARCLLETKCYEHSCWPQFVHAQGELLLKTPEEEWNDAWLRELHLFGVVTRDARECAAHTGRSGREINLEKLYKRLASKQQTSLYTLLNAYATQDAAATIRMAEVSNLNLAEDFPEIIVNNCDQRPFFSIILEQAKREPRRVRIWATLFCEAGLRSKAVADLLASSPPLEEWYVPAHPDFRERWHARGITRYSLYSQCLTIACSKSRTEVGYEGIILPLLKYAPAPGRFSWCSAVNAYIAIIMAVFLPIAAIFDLGNGAFRSQKLTPPLYIFAFVMYIPLFSLAFIRGVYQFMIFHNNGKPSQPAWNPVYIIESLVSLAINQKFIAVFLTASLGKAFAGIKKMRSSPAGFECERGI